METMRIMGTDMEDKGTAKNGRFFFAWEACREYILTINMLKRRGKCMVNRCFMCKLIRNYVAWMSTDLQILDNDLRIFGNKLGNSWFGES